MEEALELAQTATTMDKQGKYPAASDYYDLTILNLNECLSLLPKDSDVYKSILVFREKYNRRIEILSEGGSITSLLNTSSNHYDGRNSLVDGLRKILVPKSSSIKLNTSIQITNFE